MTAGLVGRLDALQAALRAERALPRPERSTEASDHALDRAVDTVARAWGLVATGHRDAANRLMAEVSRQVADTWSPTSPVSTEVLACAQALAPSTTRAPAPGADRPRETGAGDPGVWPPYVRYPVIAVLAAVGLIGVITVLYDRGWLPLVGPFVAVVVASTLVFVLMWWRSRKLQRVSGDTAARLAELGRSIGAERGLPVADRASGASDQSLDEAGHHAESALQQLAWGHEQGAASVIVERLVPTARSWRPDAPLTHQVARLEDDATAIHRVVRSMLAAAERRRRTGGR